MAPHFHVKTRFLAAVLVAFSSFARAGDVPDAAAILKTVRVAQTAQQQTLTGRLRTGSTAIPFQLSMQANTVRWDFSDPPQTLLLRLGPGGATLEESRDGTSQKVTAARFDDKVRGSDISYEDLSMRFLYWPEATVEGEQTMMLTKCWIIRTQPAAKGDSQYSAVKLWIAKTNGALLQAEALGADGKLVRFFKVVSGHSLGDGLWILKRMRIESPTTIGGRTQDRTPTYLEIEKPEE